MQGSLKGYEYNQFQVLQKCIETAATAAESIRPGATPDVATPDDALNFKLQAEGQLLPTKALTKCESRSKSAPPVNTSHRQYSTLPLRRCDKQPVVLHVKRLHKRKMEPALQEVKDKTAVFIQSRARKIDRTPAATEVVVTRLAGGATETATEAEQAQLKRKMEAAAVKIQSVTIGNCDRRWVQRFKRKMENAAVKIQSVTRGNCGRRSVQKLLDEIWHDPLAHLAYPGNAQNRTFAAEDCQEPP